jgi:hypothetical protein
MIQNKSMMHIFSSRSIILYCLRLDPPPTHPLPPLPLLWRSKPYTPTRSHSPRDGYTPHTADAPSAPKSASEQGSLHSSTSMPPIYPSTTVPSVMSMPTLPPSTESSIPPLNRLPSTDGADTHREVVRVADSIPDPSSIFAIATSLIRG